MAARWLVVAFGDRARPERRHPADAIEKIDHLAHLRAQFTEQVEGEVEPLEVCTLLGQARADRVRLASETLNALHPNVEPLLPDPTDWTKRELLEDACLAYARAAALRRGQRRFGAASTIADEPRVIAAGTQATARRLLAEVVASSELDQALQVLDQAWGGHFVHDAAAAEVPVGSLAARCAEAEAAPRRLVEWVVFQHILDRAAAAGPLNMEGGWRRLNVLVTRAKFLVLLVTSMQSHQLGAVAPAIEAETNDFEDAIAEGLRSRGLLVDEQIGASSFRIDLAVRDPRNPGRYVLGIECDGATYHSSRAARDRDLLRAEMLGKMGWRLHRIWSLDWFRDPEATLDVAVRAVERAMALGEPAEEVPAPPAPNPEVDPPLATPIDLPAAPLRYPDGVVYQRARLRSRRDRDTLLSDWAIAALSEDVAEVVAIESPIHTEELLDRL